MKNKVVLFVTGYIMLIFSSCLNSDDVDYKIVRDPQIASFSLSHDSISGLSDVKFVIDQVSTPGLIYNRDSLPYGTDKIIEEKDYKFVASISFTTGVSYIELIPQATGDTVLWTGSDKDSIDFSQPVDIKTIAYDRFTSKRYLAKLNVHQVLPDTMIWQLYDDNQFSQRPSDMKVISFPYRGKTHNLIYSFDGDYDLDIVEVPSFGSLISKEKTTVNLPSVNLSQLINFRDALVVPTVNGKLYFSDNGFDWKDANLNYFVVSVLGEIKPEDNDMNDAVLSVIIEDDGELYFAALTKEFLFVTKENEIIKEQVPEEFPIEGFGIINYSASYYARFIIDSRKNINGKLLNTTWMSTNGINWNKQTAKEYFEPKSGVVTTQYDGKFYMLGGLVEGSKQTNDIYSSLDRGVSWALADSTVVFPEEFKARGYGSVYVNEDQFMFIFGGKEQESGNVINEIWKGRINRLGFEIQ